MITEPPVEIHDRVCPLCGIALSLAWGRVAGKYYWHHPINIRADKECPMRHKGIRFAERYAALIATEIFRP